MKANGMRALGNEARVAKKKAGPPAPKFGTAAAVRSLVGGLSDRDARDTRAIVRTLRLLHELRRDTVIC